MAKKTMKIENKQKSIRTVIVVGLVAGFISGGVVPVIRHHVNSVAQQSVNVAFYNISEQSAKAIEENINKVGLQKTSFKEISFAEFNDEKSKKSYDLIFTTEGLASDNKKSGTSNFSGKLYGYLPTSLRRQNEPGDRKTIPVLLDHFEFSYNKNIALKVGFEQQNPQTFDQLQSFLESSKKYTFTPFFTNGGDDEILLGLLSALIEGNGGYDAYKTFVQAVKKNPVLENVIDLNLIEGSDFTLRTVLDNLRSWQENGIVHPAWYRAKYRDILAFVEDGQVAVLFTKLSVHRTIPYKLIRDFATERAPVSVLKVDHAVISPAIIALKSSGKSANDKVLNYLLSEEGQTSLSMKSHLGPVALRGESYDVQADDVRFFAASCRYGARADLSNAAFVPDSETAKKLCDQIRSYLNTGRI